MEQPPIEKEAELAALGSATSRAPGHPRGSCGSRPHSASTVQRPRIPSRILYVLQHADKLNRLDFVPPPRRILRRLQGVTSGKPQQGVNPLWAPPSGCSLKGQGQKGGLGSATARKINALRSAARKAARGPSPTGSAEKGAVREFSRRVTPIKAPAGKGTDTNSQRISCSPSGRPHRALARLPYGKTRISAASPGSSGRDGEEDSLIDKNPSLPFYWNAPRTPLFVQ